jgi:hypothetical protein
MTKEIGLWIDHKQAVIVTSLEQDGDVKRISSKVDTGASGSSEDTHDRHIENQLGQFYDEVIEHLGNATAIFIMGPGEAKTELQKRLETQGIGEGIVTVKSADNLTDNQVAAEVRQHFQ